MKLKATKSSLYRLAGNFMTLPPLSKTTFNKVKRSASYYLEWYADGVDYRAFLSACAGVALLVVETWKDRQVYRPSLEMLMELGLLDASEAELQAIGLSEVPTGPEAQAV